MLLFGGFSFSDQLTARDPFSLLSSVLSSCFAKEGGLAPLFLAVSPFPLVALAASFSPEMIDTAGGFFEYLFRQAQARLPFRRAATMAPFRAAAARFTVLFFRSGPFCRDEEDLCRTELLALSSRRWFLFPPQAGPGPFGRKTKRTRW